MLLHTAPLYRTHPREEGHNLLYLESNSVYLRSLSFTWTEISGCVKNDSLYTKATIWTLK